ncbi:hypothetical protein BDZ85DRAFT_53827 [Elsinoe ampelina]|uniref:Nephrocystin 3-like N-terminal domain-containing protein n=1 Tax=Elsinoe ampelina TaxID=302913 RepID=A0A6A6GMB9_9PEZI|nr:hypothetical protein BDZ85DRAFT_53827 [Elsinoe ampelina]
MAEKPKKDLSIIRHGLDVLHNPDQADVDVIAVPGLGAHPRDSWKSMDGKAFNWLISEDGIRRDLRKARIMLYQYGSAWVGSLKVTQFLSGIAAHMLADLMVLRKDCRKRPIVFIGHSMGGLVIAKVVCIADAQKEKFPSIFESISGSLFFGTPFHGAPVAAIAAMLSQVGTYMNQTVASKLLELMTPGNEALDELRMEFVRLSNRGSTKISLCCFWEIHETNASDFAGLDKTSITAKIFNTVIPNSLVKFVDRDSASLEGVTRYGLEKNHRDLVRYESLTDEKFRVPREEIRSMVRDAPSIAKGRHNAARTIDREQYNSIMEVLEGINVRKHREGLKKNVAASSWLNKEDDYQIWRHGQEGIRHENNMDGLWIRGTQGRGKTGVSIAALDDLDTYIRDIQDPNQAAILLAYFFCDSSKECGTAEELLKSIIRQLIRQQEALAIYTKNFVKSKSGSGSEVKTLASVNSVENLWLCLQEMLTDDSVGGVYFVINNLHALPESADSTKKLLGMLRHEMELVDNQEEQRVPIRWLITSQDTHSIRINLGWEGVRLVDLEDMKYEDSVKAELRKHAQKKVTALRDEKHYNKALAYFASSLIGKRAQNTQWIDITCQHLAGLSGADTAYEVRRVLEKIPQDLTELLNRSWLQILQGLGVEAEKVKEMLRSLALSFDDPIDAELALLSGLDTTEDDCAKIRSWAESCKPLLVVKATKTTHKITFLNEVVKAHLQQNGAFLLGLSEEEKRWQHGILSFRCYEHLADTLKIEQPQEENQDNDDPEDSPTDEVPDDAAEVASVAQSVAIPTRPASAASALAPMSVAVSQIPEEDEPDIASNVDSVKEIDATEAPREQGSDEQKQVLEQVQATLEDDTDSDTEVVLHNDETANADSGSLDYAVRHWLHHASKATPEIAEELSQEVAFWGPGSLLRLAWIKQYEKLTDCYVGFDALDRSLLTGLHIAASFGFRQLVASLLANGHMDELNVRENMSNAPVRILPTAGCSPPLMTANRADLFSCTLPLPTVG